MADEECKEIQLNKTLANLPKCQRGYGFLMSYTNTKTPQYLYCTGKAVVMRSFDDSSDAAVFAEHNNNTTAAAFNQKSGEYVCSGDDSGTVKIWGRGNFIPKGEYPCCQSVNDIVWGPDGKRICVVGKGGAGQYAKVFAWDTGSNLGSITNVLDHALSCDYRHSRPYRIVIAAEDNSVSIHEGPPFKYKAKSKEHTRYPNKVKYAPPTGPDKKQEVYATAGSDGTIKIWDGSEGTLIKSIDSAKVENGHVGAIYSFDWSDDGKEIATCGADKTVKIWDVEAEKVVTTFTIEETPDVGDMQMCVIWNGNHLMSTSLNGQINVLDRENPSAPKEKIQGHAGQISTICNGPNGTFFTGCSEGRVSHWSADFKAKWCQPGTKKITSIAVSGNGEKLFVATYDSKIFVTDISGAAEGVYKSGGAFATPKVPKQIAAAGDMVAAVYGEQLGVFQADGTKVKEIDVGMEVVFVGYSPDGAFVAVGSAGSKKTVVVYKTSDWSVAWKDDSFDGYISSVGFSPDSKYLAVGDKSQSLLFDVAADFKGVNNWCVHTTGTSSFCFGSDRIVTVSKDQSIVIWRDMETFKMSKRVTRKNCHRHGIHGAILLGDKVLVSVGGDGCMKVWDLE